MKYALGAVLALAVGGCSSTPQQTLTKLDHRDQKFASAECSDIRARAVHYDDKVAERAVTGLALGLFLGPFGLPFAAAADASQEEQRKGFNREITLRCVTGGSEAIAKQDAEQEQAWKHTDAAAMSRD
jgi:hypothetical protein